MQSDIRILANEPDFISIFFGLLAREPRKTYYFFCCKKKRRKKKEEQKAQLDRVNAYREASKTVWALIYIPTSGGGGGAYLWRTIIR